MSAGAAGASAAAAAAIHRQREQEEEEMTPYQPADLSENWEFKILRSNMAAFRKPERLAAVLEEEAKAGWVLVEKFDDSRIRLKRPASARASDDVIGFDPYRTYVGMSPGKFAAVLVVSILGGVLVVILIAAAIAGALHK
jgi:hypothetical protein